MELLIRNGFVYDPINGVNGEKMDIAVKAVSYTHLTLPTKA